MEGVFERDNQALWKRGGCDTKWDGFCSSDRFLWFRAAVSGKVGYTKFVISDSPYCGSLGDFTEKSGSAAEIDPKLQRNPETKHWMTSCYNTKSKEIKVFTVSLASI